MDSRTTRLVFKRDGAPYNTTKYGLCELCRDPKKKNLTRFTIDVWRDYPDERSPCGFWKRCEDHFACPECAERRRVEVEQANGAT